MPYAQSSTIQHAISTRNSTIVGLVLGFGAKVQSSSFSYAHVLQEACESKEENIVTMILKAGLSCSYVKPQTIISGIDNSLNRIRNNNAYISISTLLNDFRNTIETKKDIPDNNCISDRSQTNSRAQTHNTMMPEPYSQRAHSQQSRLPNRKIPNLNTDLNEINNLLSELGNHIKYYSKDTLAKKQGVMFQQLERMINQTPPLHNANNTEEQQSYLNTMKTIHTLKLDLTNKLTHEDNSVSYSSQDQANKRKRSSIPEDSSPARHQENSSSSTDTRPTGKRKSFSFTQDQSQQVDQESSTAI